MISTRKPKPFVKWAGGKRQVINEIVSRLPDSYNKYYEPFVGGGALLFELLPEKASINDINAELVNVYRIVKNQVNKLINELKVHKNEKEYFYRVRSINPEELNEVKRASRFIFLNKTCYNGLWRVNRKGRFNAPFGSYRTPTILDEENILSVSKYLRNADIALNSVDFSRAVEDAESGDFIYLDPPYQPISGTAYFTKYNGSGFDEYEQQRLADVFRCLDNRGCYVMLSNSNTDLINNLYSDYSREVIKANRAINCNAKKRKGATELIIRNYR